jgi:hypothetical protein
MSHFVFVLEITPTFIGAGVWLGSHRSSGEWLSHKDFGGTTACSGVWGLNGFRYAALLHRAPSVSISQFTRNIAHNRVASAFSGTPSAEIHVHS